MPRLLAALAVAFVAASAEAASVSLSREAVSVANPADLGPGDVVRLIVTVNAGLNEREIEVYGDLLFNGTGSIAPLDDVVTQTPLQSYGFFDWILGLAPCSDSVCTMFNQLCCLGTATVSNTPLVISSADFLITAPGLLFASWDPDTFDFFGAPPSPAICVTCPIPEPATGALLALGLSALASRVRKNAGPSRTPRYGPLARRESAAIAGLRRAFATQRAGPEIGVRRRESFSAPC